MSARCPICFAPLMDGRCIDRCEGNAVNPIQVGMQMPRSLEFERPKTTAERSLPKLRDFGAECGMPPIDQTTRPRRVDTEDKITPTQAVIIFIAASVILLTLASGMTP